MLESSIRCLPSETADIDTFDLSTAKVQCPNIRKEENQVIPEFKANPTIIILRGDKGNVTVILNKSDFLENITDDSYQQLSRDTIIKQDITSLIKSCEIPIEIFKNLIPKESVTPRHCEPPKIYKPDIPLRPIVSTVGSPT